MLSHQPNGIVTHHMLVYADMILIMAEDFHLPKNKHLFNGGESTFLSGDLGIKAWEAVISFEHHNRNYTRIPDQSLLRLPYLLRRVGTPFSVCCDYSHGRVREKPTFDRRISCMNPALYVLFAGVTRSTVTQQFSRPCDASTVPTDSLSKFRLLLTWRGGIPGSASSQNSVFI